MAYEGQWLYQIEVDRPTGGEDKSLGDNAIREIKTMLKNMFRGSFDKGESDVYTGTLSQLNDLVSGGTFPRNAIIAWAPESQIAEQEGPDGWTICDGRSRADGNGGVAPDLRARFIVGSKIDSDEVESITTPGDPGNVIYFPPESGKYGGQQEYNLWYDTSRSSIWELHTKYPGAIYGTYPDSGGLEQGAGSSGSDGVTPDLDGLMEDRSHGHVLEIRTPSEIKAGNNVPPFFSALYIIKD